MTVDGPQINRPARPAARTEDVEPGRSGDRIWSILSSHPPICGHDGDAPKMLDLA
jgi:hypothetical protein